jgi:hypothetical protein
MIFSEKNAVLLLQNMTRLILNPSLTIVFPYDSIIYSPVTTACRVLVGRPEGKRPLGRPRRRWEDNIKMDLQEV